MRRFGGFLLRKSSFCWYVVFPGALWARIRAMQNANKKLSSRRLLLAIALLLTL